MTNVEVTAGICGFTAIVSAQKVEKLKTMIQIECEKIASLGEILLDLDLQDIFQRPFNNGKIYTMAARSNIHASCPIPCAIIKAVEVEMGLALKKDVKIIFKEG